MPSQPTRRRSRSTLLDTQLFCWPERCSRGVLCSELTSGFQIPLRQIEFGKFRLVSVSIDNRL